MPGTRGPVPVPLRDGNRDLTKEILDELDTRGAFASQDAFPDVSQAEVKAALDRLASRLMISYNAVDTDQVELTSEGQTICDEGSHEFKVYDAVRRAGKIELKELQV